MSVSPTPGPRADADAVHARYRVGDLLIDTGRQRVTRGEHVIALPKLSYDLLLALVRAAPNLAAPDALMEQVWPRAVVSPETLGQRIKLLRDALGDDPHAPRYIEGLRGRGYRLIPRAEAASPASAAPAGAVKAEASPVEPRPAPGAGTTGVPAIASVLEANVPAAPPMPAPQPLVYPPVRRRRSLGWPSLIAVSLLGGLALLLIVRQMKPAATTRPTSVEVVAVPPRTVAVLPFDNLSAEPNNDYIALGIADSVLHQLASSPDLIVISRSSSFALGEPAPEPREAGRRLGVRYLVSGSVQRAGSVLRVTAQLVDTSSGVELWSVRLDRTIDDVFALQDQIAQRVAQRLDAAVHSRSLDDARYGTDAYLAFLKGRALLESRKVNDVEASIQQFSRAVELAPTFAAAIAELARAKGQLQGLGSEPVADASQTSEIDALVARAIEIDPRAGEPYFLRARRKLEDGDTRGAEADFRRGLDLAPNFGPGIRGYAEYLERQGREDEALEQLDRARLVEPLSAENHYRKAEILRISAQSQQFEGEPAHSRAVRLQDDAATLYLQALSVQPEFYPAYTRLAQVRWEKGKLAEAIKYGEKAVAVEPAVGWTRQRLVWFYVDLGDLGAARDVLRGYAPGSAAMAAADALVCYRAGDLERAAAILRDHIHAPHFTVDGFAMNFAPAVIVELAIARHDPSPARQFIMNLPGLRKTDGSPDVVDENFPWIVQLATLEHATGDRAVANDLARRSLQYLNASDVHREFVGGWDEWSRAAASAILGRDDAALAHLEELLRAGVNVGWWARIERDPAFVTLRSTPRFQAIMSALQQWLRGEVRQLTLMRSRGEVPIRSSERLSPQGC